MPVQSTPLRIQRPLRWRRATIERDRPGQSQRKVHVRRRYQTQGEPIKREKHSHTKEKKKKDFFTIPRFFPRLILLKINAMANRAAGKGYENENFYENIKFQFCGIENIHVMRSSLSKMLEACELKTPSMAAFINGIQSSGWLRHIHAILDTSLLVARSLQEGVNVLVHCSDGQLISICC